MAATDGVGPVVVAIASVRINATEIVTLLGVDVVGLERCVLVSIAT
jgi:hypothetical protein